MLTTVFALLLHGAMLPPAAARHGAMLPPAAARHAARPTRPELRTAARFETARKAGPLALHAFLERMPKGADLHMHLSGAVYAETLIKDAVEDHLCIDPVRFELVRNLGVKEAQVPLCPDGTIPASSAVSPLNPTAQKLYDSLVDAFSMRTFTPASGTSGHDQFFATFGRFGGLGAKHAGEWLDEVATRAAAQNEQYLEVMQTPPFAHAASLGKKFGWPATQPAAQFTAPTSIEDDVSGTSGAELATLREKLLAAGLRDEVVTDRNAFDEAETERQRLENCGTPHPTPACDVKIRFLYQVLRAFPPQQVFAQALLGFEVASIDPDVVGINFVQPEDSYQAMTEYKRQMRMLEFLHATYPKVHISLHAGEVAPGLVPPTGLHFHIREAVDLGHAERIGHGVDVIYERDPGDLLKEMAEKHVMVEINITSNDVILGVSGRDHPLSLYRSSGVPVSLSTDDEGVSRIDLTHEYVRAVLEFGLGYLDLKRMVRTGMEHTFLPGSTLWAKPDDFTNVVPACTGVSLGTSPSPRCRGFLRSNSHAAEQWELERRFQVFETD